MKALLFILGFSISSWATPSESVTLSRYFTIKTCYKGQTECIGPVAKQIESANSDIELKAFKKGTSQGLDGWNRETLTEQGVPFKSEIHVIKHSKPGKHKYMIHVMLRSANKNGKIKTINLKELSDLQQTILTDEPIKFKDGTLQAQIVLGPKLNIEEHNSK